MFTRSMLRLDTDNPIRNLKYWKLTVITNQD